MPLFPPAVQPLIQLLSQLFELSNGHVVDVANVEMFEVGCCVGVDEGGFRLDHRWREGKLFGARRTVPQGS